MTWEGEPWFLFRWPHEFFLIDSLFSLFSSIKFVIVDQKVREKCGLCVFFNFLITSSLVQSRVAPIYLYISQPSIFQGWKA